MWVAQGAAVGPLRGPRGLAGAYRRRCLRLSHFSPAGWKGDSLKAVLPTGAGGAARRFAVAGVGRTVGTCERALASYNGAATCGGGQLAGLAAGWME